MRTNTILRPALITMALLVGLTAEAADLVWIGGTGNWNAAGNWSPAQVPTAADNAWITNSGTYTVTVPAGSVAVNNSLIVGGASGTQTLAVDRATLTLNGASIIGANGQLALLVSQSVVTGPGSLVVNGTVNWANGTISGTGTATINAGAVLAIGSGGTTLARTLNNSGSVTWGGCNLTISAGNTVNNLSGGTFDINADGRLSGAATTPINNSGLLRLNAGTTGTFITAPLNNAGTLQVLASMLNLNLGGTHTGTFSNAAGATLNLGGGSHSLSSGSRVAGAGTLSLSGAATLTASGSFDSGTTLNVSGGTATLAPSCNVTGTTLNIGGNNGILLFNTAGSAAAVNVSAGTLGGTSPIIVTGPLTLAGGTVTNSLVTANGGLAVSGNTTLNGTKLINPATAVWSAGNITGANGAAISNLVGAAFINTFDGNVATGAGATPLFINEGTFAKTNGTAAQGVTSIDFQFINTGTVEVQTNTLRYAVNQQTTGITLLDGGGLSAQAQPLQILGGSLIGTGLVTVANAQNVINASSISPGLPLGELDIAGNYQQTSSGALNIDLGGYTPGTTFDLVTVAAGGAGGVATLGGTLNVSLVNGFSPTNGASFTFLTAASRVGSFTTFNYPSNDIGMQVSYEPASVTLKVTNLKPVVANPINDPAPVTYGSPFTFQFPANTFTDPDGNLLTYTASGLPPGIAFTGATRTLSGNAAQAGTFPVTVTATDNGTPSLSVTANFTIIINPAPLGVTAQAQSKTYGAADPALTYDVTGLQLGDTPAAVLTGTLARVQGESVAGSPYAITQGTLAANSNYILTFTGNALSITPAPLLVTADSQGKVYGAADPPFTANYAGFVNGETPADLGGVITFARAPGQNVGSYAITPGGLTSVNYAITFIPGTLAIMKAVLAATADNKTKTYGSTDPEFTVSYSGFVNGDTPSVLSGSPVFTRATGENVGTYQITPGGVTSANYAITFTPGTFAITKAALAVTADDKTKIYGASDPAFSVTYAGFVNGETSTVLGGALVFTRAAGENVGTYQIKPGGLTSANYAITFNPGTLTVTKAALAVTADDKAKVYGTPDPVFSVSYAGFANGDTPIVLAGTLSFGRAPGENVGSYVVTPSGLTSANYAITFNPGTLAISKAALAVTADDKTKTYGASDPAFSVTYFGLVNGDTAATLAGTLTLNRASGENVGSYAITPSGLLSSNYTITFNAGTLNITRATLSITTDSKTKAYGTIDPPFTATYAGLVNTETPAVLGGTLAFVRAAGENVGSYAITPGGLTSANYAITFNPGTLTIGKAPLSITAESKSKIYGAADPPFTVAYAGFVNGEAPNVLGGALTLVRSPGENVGSYAITPGGLTSANYAINFITGALAITKAPLSIAADSKTKIYGQVDPPLTFTVNGLQLTDTQASVLTGALMRATGESVAGGPYAITQGTLAANDNYTVAFTGNKLTITPATLTVAAQAKAKTYGTADPALPFTVSGFQFTDTQASVLTGALTRAPGESVAGSPYEINQGTLAANGNYTINFTHSALTVTPAPLLVTAQDATRAYGQTNPVFTAIYTGFINGETNTALSGLLELSSVAETNSPVGTYPITASSLTATDYSIVYSNGTLTVLPQALTITAQDKTKTYGSADPVFTAGYSGFVNGETSTSLDGTLAFNRAPGENAGTYTITPSGLTSTNYAITFVDGTLTVDKAPLTITADNQNKMYGSPDPTLTFKATGLQFSDTPASVLQGALVRGAGETVAGSPYVITQGTLTANDNYTIRFNSGALNITPAPLSATADSKTKTYGAADPPFTVSYTGFVKGETEAVLGGTLSLTRTAGENVGVYAITPSGVTNPNYAISFIPGALTIVKAALAVRADSKTKVYGEADPAFTVSYIGFVNGDTAVSLQGTLDITRAPGETPGQYAITAAGLTSPNYTISFEAGTLTIVAPAPVILSLRRTTAASIELTWSAVSNATYRVQYTADFTATHWTDLDGDVLASGSTAFKTDIFTPGNRYYRVRVLP